MTRPIQALVNLAALRHNHALARQHIGDARMWSVIKANGYGHGALRMAQGLAEVADGFALLELDTALALRAQGIRQPLLLLEGFYNTDELQAFVQHRLIPVIHRLDQASALARSGFSLPVYLKLNTGMNRLGLNADQLSAALDLLRGHDITLMTHFSDADEALGIDDQMQRLNTMRAGLDYPLCLANSAALLRFPEVLGDWVRPGIMLYGSSPFPQMRSAAEIGLRPVMTLTSELIAMRCLQPGDRVGYGGAFVAERAMTIGLVACGYGDGYPRHAPTGTPILVNGQRARTVGRVSMDKVCVDLTGIGDAKVGSLATLWGEGLSADEVATSAGTVSYELFCALASRVPVVEQG
ncbi:MAG: alanine racemase [Georgfuchsia sp.]